MSAARLAASLGLLFVALLAATPAGADDFTCTPTEVAVFEGRIHVRCSDTVEDGNATIRFWAVATTDAEYANLFLSTAVTALISGRSLILKYTPGETSGTAFDCGADNCRS